MLAIRRGYPAQIRVDNGPEFISHHMVAWAEEHAVKIEYIQPGKPAQNGFVERFNRTHVEEFYQVYADDWEMTVMNKVLEEWERIYNQVRLHHSLDNLTPKEYIQSNYPQCWPQVSHRY